MTKPPPKGTGLIWLDLWFGLSKNCKLKKRGINIKSGFLVDELKRPGEGGLLILEMNNYKSALKIIKNDPMIKNNLVEWKLNEWVDSNKWK